MTVWEAFPERLLRRLTTAQYLAQGTVLTLGVAVTLGFVHPALGAWWGMIYGLGVLAFLTHFHFQVTLGRLNHALEVRDRARALRTRFLAHPPTPEEQLMLDTLTLQSAALQAQAAGDYLRLELALNEPYPANFPAGEREGLNPATGNVVYKLDPHEVLLWLDREGRLSI